MKTDRIELGNASIQMTRTNSESRGDPFVIRLRDHDSGVVLGEYELDAEGIANLMSGRMAYTTEAKLATQADYEHVGYVRTVTSERVPDDQLIYGVPYAAEEAVQTQHLDPYAERRRAEVNADTVRIHKDKGGWKLTFHSYRAPEEVQD